MTSMRRFGDPDYSALVKDLSGLLESARRAYARAVNAAMTATYWELGRRIVEFEQRGERRAEYGAELLEKVLPRFLLYQLPSSLVQDDQIDRLSKGSAFPHLNIGALSAGVTDRR